MKKPMMSPNRRGLLFGQIWSTWNLNGTGSHKQSNICCFITVHSGTKTGLKCGFTSRKLLKLESNTLKLIYCNLISCNFASFMVYKIVQKALLPMK